MDSFQEDMVSNAMLFAAGVIFMALRDVCKRLAHSECRYEDGLVWKLPTWRPDAPDPPDDDLPSLTKHPRDQNVV